MMERNELEHHRGALMMVPPRGINYVDQKGSIIKGILEIKKHFVGDDIKQKENQIAIHRGPFKGPATRI